MYGVNPNDSAQPQVIIKRGLVLNQDRENWLLNRVEVRLNEVESEMGIGTKGELTSDGFMFHRQNYQDQYDNNWQWRQRLGGIFQYSNWSLNMAKRFARLISAKTGDDLLGTEPFFSAMPKKGANPELAKQLEWWLQEQFSKSNFIPTGQQGILSSLIRGEAVLKPSYKLQQSRFFGQAIVLVNRSGEPIITPKGNYIYQDDDFVPDPSVEGVLRLRKEPSFTVPPPDQARFQYFESLQQQQVVYEGLNVGEVNYKDWRCPLRFNTPDEADINAHVFDEFYGTMAEKYSGLPGWNNYQNTYQSADKAANLHRGELDTVAQDANIINAADVYIRADADNDGMEEEIWIVYDRTRKKAIFYDYTANHQKRRPFVVIPGLEKVSGRWYGVGVFEMLGDKQAYIETQFNRENFKSSKSSSLTFRQVSANREWNQGQQLVVGDDVIHDITDPTYNAQNPPVFQVHLTDTDENAMKLIELVLQMSQTEVGIISANDADSSGLLSSKTATGVRNIERTGNQLTKAIESNQIDALEDLIEMSTDILLENMDPETLVMMPDSSELTSINKEEAKNMPKNIKLLLSRTRSTETLENSQAVIQLCNAYYALNPYMQFKLRDEYIRQLKALEVQDADNLLDEVTQQQADAYKANPPSQQEPPKVSMSVAAKLTDLAPSERGQVLQKEGVTPAQPQELEQKAADDLATATATHQATTPTQPPPDKL